MTSPVRFRGWQHDEIHVAIMADRKPGPGELRWGVVSRWDMAGFSRRRFGRPGYGFALLTCI